MDLFSSESKKTGTRGGKSQFTWDSVQDKERHYYLGNSIAKPITGRHGSNSQHPMWYIEDNRNNTSNEKKKSNSIDMSDEKVTIRRREKKIMENVVIGQSFSDAVRSALAESVASGVDDEGSRGDGEENFNMKINRNTSQEKSEKAERKEMRRRIREQRRLKRAERYRVRLGKEEEIDALNRSSESERETSRGYRLSDDMSKRRRRKERDCATRRKRSEVCSSSDSEDTDGHRSRRQRIR